MLKNMKIGKKIIFAFVLVQIAYCIVGAVAVVITDNINTAYSDALTNYGLPQSDIGLFNAEINNCRSTIRDVLLETNPQKIKSNIDKFEESAVKANTNFADMKNGMVSSKEQNSYNDIKANVAEYKTVCGQIAALAQQGKRSEAYTLLKENAEPVSDKITTAAQTLMTEKTAAAHQMVSNLDTQGNDANIMIFVVLAVCIFISILISVKMARNISNSVADMAEAAKKMAQGDLSTQIRVNSTNEIGQLGAAFSETMTSVKAYIADLTKNLGEVERGNLAVVPTLEYKCDFNALKNSFIGILNSLNDTLFQIDQASDQVSNGSEQVSNGAQALAQSTTEQASSIEELSASISEMLTDVKKNAVHAAHASEKVNAVSVELEENNKQMQKMIAAMSRINASSNKIGQVIKTIEDIAFQTNILALNAAVEAARAGAAGKGFAVVADEVRNLASKSADAAKETTVLIQNSIEEVKSGTEIADQTAQSLLQVVDRARSVTETVEKISRATNRQSDAIAQVTQGVEQISSVVQTNSATAEQSAAASEELSKQAHILKALVGKFKLRNTSMKMDTPLTAQPETSGNIIPDSKY